MHADIAPHPYKKVNNSLHYYIVQGQQLNLLKVAKSGMLKLFMFINTCTHDPSILTLYESHHAKKVIEVTTIPLLL